MNCFAHSFIHSFILGGAIGQANKRGEIIPRGKTWQGLEKGSFNKVQRPHCHDLGVTLKIKLLFLPILSFSLTWLEGRKFFTNSQDDSSDIHVFQLPTHRKCLQNHKYFVVGEAVMVAVWWLELCPVPWKCYYTVYQYKDI